MQIKMMEKSIEWLKTECEQVIEATAKQIETVENRRKEWYQALGKC